MNQTKKENTMKLKTKIDALNKLLKIEEAKEKADTIYHSKKSAEDAQAGAKRKAKRIEREMTH